MSLEAITALSAITTGMFISLGAIVRLVWQAREKLDEIIAQMEKIGKNERRIKRLETAHVKHHGALPGLDITE